MLKVKIILFILFSIGVFYIIGKATKVDEVTNEKKSEKCTDGKSKYLAESVRGGCFEICLHPFFL